MEGERLVDVHVLFPKYNERHFGGLLGATVVEWSTKMTLCAGVCYLRRQGGGRYCVIRLSRPLLQSRPQSDTASTLLHEMIHAYFWVRGGGSLDRSGHGPDFVAMAARINAQEQCNITVYHTFHAEVEACRSHVWICNGPCRYRPPFFGTVRRAINRAPQPADWWWKRHQRECGGVFAKSSEAPPEYQMAGSKAVPKGAINHWKGRPNFAKDEEQTKRTRKSAERELTQTHVTEKEQERGQAFLELRCPGCQIHVATSLDSLNDHLDSCLGIEVAGGCHSFEVGRVYDMPGDCCTRTDQRRARVQPRAPNAAFIDLTLSDGGF